VYGKLFKAEIIIGHVAKVKERVSKVNKDQKTKTGSCRCSSVIALRKFIGQANKKVQR